MCSSWHADILIMIRLDLKYIVFSEDIYDGVDS